MNRTAMIAIIVVLLAVGGGTYWLTRSKSSSAKNTTSTADVNGQSASKSSDTKSTNTVAIKNFAFDPVTLTVKKGTTVTWTNQDSMAHTVTETDGKVGPNSGSLDQGKSYSFTFDTVGTYTYHCDIHPSMTGTVKVTE